MRERLEPAFERDAIQHPPGFLTLHGIDEILGRDRAAIAIENARKALVKRNMRGLSRLHNRLKGKPHAPFARRIRHKGKGIAIPFSNRNGKGRIRLQPNRFNRCLFHRNPRTFAALRGGGFALRKGICSCSVRRRRAHLAFFPGKNGRDNRLRALARPIRIAPHPRNLAPLGIKQNRDRQAQHGHLARHILFWIKQDRQRLYVLFLKKALDARKGVSARGQRNNFEILAAKLLLKRIKGWHFLPAGGAPGGPEVQKHMFALPIRKAAFGAIGLGEDRAAHLRRFGVKHELLHVALAKLFQRGGIGEGGICAKREGRVEDGGSNELHFPSGIKDMTDKTANAMWGGRFAAGPDAIMEAINASIGFDKRLAAQDIAGSRAHAAMLAAQGIISTSDAEAIREGLLTVLSEIEGGQFTFSAALEDIHMNVEARLKELVGEPAGRLHTARSRNDQVATDFRLWVRDQIDAADQGLAALTRALLAQAEAGADWVMPGFTHLQTAQPVTWGHHMMAYVEMFGRDRSRFIDARARLNESPLGAAALAGTSFPIDRDATAEALGFSRPMANSLDAVSARDFALEFLSATAISAMHLSRLAEELVIWSSAQFRFVAMSDRFSTGSSIMPQKKNPDAAELLRAKIGRILGATVALFTVMKGLPLAYSKDMQEDKEQVFDAADTYLLSLAAMEGMVRDMAANPDALRAAAASGFSTATDLADWLVHALGLPFREAHHITGSLVAEAESRGCDLPDLPLDAMQAAHAGITEAVYGVLGVDNSVASRTSYGGTAPDQVRAQIARWREALG